MAHGCFKQRPLSDQAGQTMVEFAIVLPILLMLTFGTLELGIFLERLITLTGAGFLAARAATVGGKNGDSPDSKPAQEVLQAYANDAAQPWIASVAKGASGKLTVTTDSTHRLLRLTAVKKNESWSSIIAALSGGGRAQLGQLSAGVAINREYVKGDKGRKSANQERSNFIVNYPADLGQISQLDQQMGPYAQRIEAGLKIIPGMPQQITGLADVLTIQPLQAVSDNPERGKNHPSGAYDASYYTSDENELRTDAPFGQPKRLAAALKSSSTTIVALRNGIKASPGFQPQVLLGVQALFMAVAQAANVGTQGLGVVDKTVFGVGGP